MRKILVLTAVVMIISGSLLAGCGSSETRETVTPGQSQQSDQAGQDAEGKMFTAQELSQFDGMDGRAAYVAVDGVVYDVSGSSMWPRGSHSSCQGSVAGRDLSEVIKTAPAGMRDNLERFPAVGTLQ